MTFLRWFTLWVLLLIGFGAETGGRCWDYYRLKTKGISTQGVVKEKKPHGQIGYSFNVQGHGYEGTGRTGANTAPFEEMAKGDAVTIYYLPGSPSVNCLGDPAELYSNDLPLVLVVVLVFPTAIVLALARRFAKRGTNALFS